MEGDATEFTFDDFLPFSLEGPLGFPPYSSTEPLGFLPSAFEEPRGVLPDSVQEPPAVPTTYPPYILDEPVEAPTLSREDLIANQQRGTAEDELGNPGSEADKENRDRRFEAERKQRYQRHRVNKKGSEVLSRVLRLEDLSKGAGDKKRALLFQDLAKRARETKGAGNISDGDTEEEEAPGTPWISNQQLKARYQSQGLKPWFSELPRPRTKVKPKQARVAASKPSQPAQTDAPKRGRGRPRKYALDDPRSSLFRVNRQRDGVRRSKKTQDFTIHDDNGGTDGISQPSNFGPPPARLPLTPRHNPPSASSGGNPRIPPLATSRIRGGDPRGSRDQRSLVSRPQPKVQSDRCSEDFDKDARGEGSSSSRARARASPPPPGGGGKSVRRPSFEASFYPGMCPSQNAIENEIGEESARSSNPDPPGSESGGGTRVPSPEPRTDAWMERFKHRQYYYGGGYVVDHSR